MAAPAGIDLAGWPDRSFRAVGARSDKMPVRGRPIRSGRLHLNCWLLMNHRVPAAPNRPERAVGPPRDMLETM